MPKVVLDRSFDDVLKETSRFFMKTDDVHETLHRITRRLDDEDIDYAIAGGMALVAHGYVRYTADVDVLTTREGLDLVHRRLVGRGYVPTFPGARKSLRDTTTGTKIDFLTTGEYPGDGKPKPVRFPDPIAASVEIDGKRVLRIEKIVELKLASGLSNPNRLNDLGDVQRLIEHLNLPLDLSEKLDPSVRDTYIEYWHLNQNAPGSDHE